MFHVYKEKSNSDFSRTHIGDYSDFEEAMDAAEKSIEGNSELNYIVEETDGSFDSYGELLRQVIAKSN